MNHNIENDKNEKEDGRMGAVMHGGGGVSRPRVDEEVCIALPFRDI